MEIKAKQIKNKHVISIGHYLSVKHLNILPSYFFRITCQKSMILAESFSEQYEQITKTTFSRINKQQFPKLPIKNSHCQ